MILLIDNYDSFTYNLVQYLGELGGDCQTYRNDQIDLPELERLEPDRMVISPGLVRQGRQGFQRNRF